MALSKDERDLLDRLKNHPEDEEARWEAAQNLMPDDVFNHFLDLQMDGAREAAKKGKVENIEPLAMIVGRNKKTSEVEHIAAELMEMDEDHEAVFRTLGLMLSKDYPDLAPIAIFFQSEVWQSELPQDADDKDFIKPSKDPNRTEKFGIMARTIDGRVASTFDTIERGKDNKITLKPGMYIPYVKGAKSAESPMLHAFFQGTAVGSRGLDDETIEAMEKIGRANRSGKELTKAQKDKLLDEGAIAIQKMIDACPEGAGKDMLQKKFNEAKKERK